MVEKILISSEEFILTLCRGMCMRGMRYRIGHSLPENEDLWFQVIRTQNMTIFHEKAKVCVGILKIE